MRERDTTTRRCCYLDNMHKISNFKNKLVSFGESIPLVLILSQRRRGSQEAEDIKSQFWKLPICDTLGLIHHS